MSVTQGRKELNVETLRGIAIVLVVIGHVTSSIIAGGEGKPISGNSPYHYFFDLFLNIRMPLFTFISGWVYAIHSVQRGDFPVFMRKKVRRLLLPLWVVGSIHFALRAVVPGTNTTTELHDIWQIFIFPYTLYWYLPALFLLFTSVAILDAYGKIDTPRNAAIVITAALILCLTERIHLLPAETPNVFAFRYAFELAPFFFAGVVFHRFKNELYSLKLKRVYLFLLIAGVGLQQCHYFMPDKMAWYDTLQLPVFIGFFSCACLIVQPYTNSFFIWLGKYAYTIYLFHAFGIAATRTCMRHVLGIQNDDFIFGVACVAGIFLPVLVEKICIRYGLLRMLFLGKKW